TTVAARTDREREKGTNMALAEVFEAIAGPDAPVEFRAYDGSVCGAPGSDVKITIRSPVAVSYLAQAPGALGLARAYVSGHLDVDGDMYITLSRLSRAQETNMSLAEKVKLLQSLGGPKVLVPRIPPPPQEVRINRRFLNGRMHSKGRDAHAISHHYDVSNDFYRLVLGSTMTYSCARFESQGQSLDDAQQAKYELICRKLGLAPGQRLLDVGCGWGGMVLHAAARHGIAALGVTLSRPQEELARKRAAESGLDGQVEIRLQDYRDLAGSYDAVSSIGMFEHVGRARTAEYFTTLAALLRPGGRLLNHAISTPEGASFDRRSFVARYVFPDGELQDVGSVCLGMQKAGLEVRDVECLREHYALTLRHWAANLEANWDAAVALVGERRARVWRLYMTGSAVSFEEGEISVHQVLGVKPDQGASGMALTRRAWDV
ncbi:MAG TPA: cyclopropane-fatty-acyl-phospholipid synthase family protein, partial [Acidimicrobiales bacterium]